MAFRGLRIFTWTQTKLYLREPIATFFTIFFAPLFLVLFGLIYGNEPSEFFGGLGSMDVTVPAYLGIIIVTVGLIGLPIQTSVNRELGILRRYRVTPLRPLTYIAADVISYWAMAAVGMLLLVVVGKIAYDIRFEGDILSVMAGFTLATLSFLSMGFVLASISPTARVAQTVGMVLSYPMMFLSGATIPYELLPSTVQRIADFLPLTYVVRLMRGLWFGRPWSELGLEVAVLAAILIVCSLISARFFRWE
ncbi:MAG TPA: ABC transporter permease [Candidatus Limnocylindrales bacterium]|nr:ABC transporter permease [Candidatus Limnocylindrales bacterium]